MTCVRSAVDYVNRSGRNQTWGGAASGCICEEGDVHSPLQCRVKMWGLVYRVSCASFFGFFSSFVQYCEYYLCKYVRIAQMLNVQRKCIILILLLFILWHVVCFIRLMNDAVTLSLIILIAVMLRRSLLTVPGVRTSTRAGGRNTGFLALDPVIVRADRPHSAWQTGSKR